MSDFSSITPGAIGSVGGVNRLTAATSTNGVPRTEAVTEPATLNGSPDRVELSAFARYLDQLRQLPEVRQDRVAHAKQAIEAGAYESEEILDAAIERWAEEELF